MYRKCLSLVVALGALLGALQPNAAWGQDAFIGEIRWVPFNFAPRNWAFCDGQILSISQNTALFSLLGTAYGGNGSTNFALPDFRGRLLINAGQGAGLSNYVQGQAGGTEAVTLSQTELPGHTHAVQASNQVADQTSPTGNVLAQASSGAMYGASPTASMAAGAVSTVGGGQPHNNMMPYLTLTCIIALQGDFPWHP